MENIDMEKSKVYIKTDDKNRITRCEGGYTMNNIENIDEWQLIDEGYGDKYNLCQNHYFEKPIIDENGCHNYIYENGVVREATEAELYVELNSFPITEQEPTEIEKLNARIDELTLENEFLSDCLVEIAQIVYA